MKSMWGLGVVIFILSAIILAWDWGRSGGRETEVFKWALGGVFLGIFLAGFAGT